MSEHKKMPPELLAHFKKKQGAGDESKEEAKESDKDKRKEAVKKARIRLESKNRRRDHGEEKETREERSEKA